MLHKQKNASSAAVCMNRFATIFRGRLGWLPLLLGLMGVNVLASLAPWRIDLTSEKRYTLHAGTREMLRQLDAPLEIDVFLKGEFPSGFRKLANSTRDFLSLLRDVYPSLIRFRFVSPAEQIPGDPSRTYGDSLIRMGATPINLTVQKKAGQSSNILFPVALIRYKDRQELVNLYPGASSRISQEEINSAEALLEYQFVKTIQQLSQTVRPGIAYHVGNGEPADGRTYMLRTALSEDYDFRVLNLNQQPRVPDGVDLLLVVKPTIPFSEDEKLKIDQYLMRGGKLLFFIDNLFAEQDSLALKPETIAYDRNLNLTDLFFRYGLRINTDLVMDLQCDLLPFVVGGTADNPQMELLRWNYYPLLQPGPATLSRGLGYVSSRFVNSIDTIALPGVKKEALLVSSPHSRIISTPALISLNENRNVPEDEKFKRSAIPVALLLEGSFPSLFRNRAGQSLRDSVAASGIPFRERSEPTRLIVVADGDLVFNDFLPGEEPGAPPQPLPMGYNKYTYAEYLNQSEYGRLFIPVANRDFLLNSVEYLLSSPELSAIRGKEIVLRLLDSKKVKAGRTQWQLINIALPVLLVVLCGWVYQGVRKRKFLVGSS